MKKLLSSLTLAACAVAATLPSFAVADNPIRGNIRVVIGSDSTGGDTYQAASLIANAMSERMKTNVRVDAVGASQAFRFLDRVSNGSTIMFFHDQSYLGNLYGIRGYEDIFEKYTIGQTITINPGDAFVVPKNSPYNNIQELIDAAGQGERIRVAIQPGGVSEIGYTALKNAVKLLYPGQEGNVVAVNTGSQADKNQQLFDRQADIIHGSIQANEQYTRLPEDDQRAMRFLWLTAKNETLSQADPAGFGGTSRDELLQFVEPINVVPMTADNNFTFDKEFFFLYNKDTDPKVLAYYDQVLTDIFAEGKVQEEMKKAFFIPNFRPASEAQEYLSAKKDAYRAIIEAIKE
ncbi:ABC transporter substrate-binding protein [Nitrincola nitratireducens]|uniref:ABC transporter substrate-binding protein n=1 Tax=Nitrincola nitratireducens TaxID=1229521 RepID=W9VPW0_9GAMM|nr:ABC transporter substrate-binding protein [Nitrincola nitratireducens]EXJ12475.1 hypothetical protein D791_00720 [Nitrincola nitratireducens]